VQQLSDHIALNSCILTASYIIYGQLRQNLQGNNFYHPLDATPNLPWDIPNVKRRYVYWIKTLG